MSNSLITKEALANALRKLMEKKPFNKIRISEIVELCQLERQTFYYHFEDKYGLIIWIFQQDIDQHIRFLEKKDALENVYNLCFYFDEHRTFYRNLFLNGDKRILYDMIKQSLYQKFYQEITNVYENINQEYCDFVSNYLATGTSGILIQWLLNDNHMSIKKFSEYLYGIHKQIMENFNFTIKEDGKDTKYPVIS